MASGLHLALALLINIFSIVILSITLDRGITYNEVPTINSDRFKNECIYTSWQTTYRSCDFDATISQNARTGLIVAGGVVVGMIVYGGLYAHEYYLASQTEPKAFPFMSWCTRPVFGKRRRAGKEMSRPIFAFWTFTSVVLIGALSSLTAMALFGPREATFELGGPIYSVSTKGYAAQVQEYDEFVESDLDQLRQFLVMSTFRNTRLKDYRSASTRPVDWLDRIGIRRTRLGDTLYPEMRTHGIGINAAFLGEYKLAAEPLPDRFKALPPNHIFQNLEAQVYGTEVEVECKLVSECNTPHAQGEFLSTNGPSAAKPPLYEFEVDCPFPGIQPFTIIQDRSQPLRVLHQLLRDPENAEQTPRHLFAIQDLEYSERMDWWYQRLTLVQCSYKGHDALATVQMSSLAEPFEIVGEIQEKEDLTAADLWPAIQNISSIIGTNAELFGSAMSSLLNGRYRLPLQETYANILSTTLTETAQAYWSLKRQHAEVASWSDHVPKSGDSIREGKLQTKYTRIGGGGWSWITVPAVLLGLCVVALARSLMALWILFKTTDDEWVPLSQHEGNESQGAPMISSDEDESGSTPPDQ